jgi:small-conductance mechanosensitive channel
VQPLLDRLSDWAGSHVPNAFRIVLIPLAAFVTIRLMNRLIRRLEMLADDGDPDTESEIEKRAATLGRVLRQVVVFFVWGTAAMLILTELGVSIGPILAGAGIVGVAVGFGAQALVKDMISGFFILLENQFRVHDVVSAAGVSGTVEAINLRTTVLRDVEGRVHVVPNGAITVVTNYTSEWSQALLDVGIPYRQDVDRAMAVLREVGASIEADPAYGKRILGRFEYPGIETLGDSSVVLRMSVRTQPHDRWHVRREMRARVKKAFDANGIETPFRRVTIDLDPASADAFRGRGPSGDSSWDSSSPSPPSSSSSS